MADIYEDIGTSSVWIAEALRSSGYNADWSGASLWEIDRFFDEQTVDGAAKAGGLLANGLGARLFSLGCYSGEVLRRTVGGEWWGDNDDPAAESTVEMRLPDGTVCWPVQRMMKRFKNGTEDSIAAWGSALGLIVGDRPESQAPAASEKKGFFRRVFR